MKKRLALIMATAMIASALSGTVAFASEADDTAAAAEETKDDAAGGDTMTMDEVKAAVQKSDVPSDLKLGYVCMNLANPWFVQVVEGFEAACKEMGLEKPLTVDSQYDVDKQVSDVETMVNDEYDAIMISPIDQNALTDVVTKANDAGIVTSCAAQSVDIVDFRYIVEEYSYGQVCIISQDNVEDVIARGDGVQDTLEKECPNVNVVTRQAGDTPEGGLEIVESALAAYPDLKVVVATNDSGGIGGYQALVNAGYTGSDPVAVFSGDATDEALNDMLQDDTIYRGTVDLAPYACGYESAYQLVYYCINGKPAETKTQGFTPVMVPLADLLDGTYAYDPK